MANYCTWCNNHGFNIVYNFQHRRVCKFYQCRCNNCVGTGARLAAAAKQRENERKQNAMQAGKNKNNKSQKFPANQNNHNKNNYNQKFPAKKNNNGNVKNNGTKNSGRPESSFNQHSNDKSYCRFCENHGQSYFNIGRHYSLCKYRSCPCRKCEEFRRPEKTSNKSKDGDNKRSNPSDGDSSAPGPSKRPRAESSDQAWPNCPLCINHGFKFPLKPHHVSVCLHKTCQCDPCRKERKCEKDNNDSKGDESEENVAVDPPVSAASSEATKAVVAPEKVESEKNVPVAPKPRMGAPPTEVKRPCAVVAPKPRKSISTDSDCTLGENIVTDHVKKSEAPVQPGPSVSQKSSEKNGEHPSPAEQQENIQIPQTESRETVAEDTPDKVAEDTSEQAEESEMSSSQETISSVISETIGAPELLDDEYKTVSEASDSSNDAVPFVKLSSKRRVLMPETSNEASDSAGSTPRAEASCEDQQSEDPSIHRLTEVAPKSKNDSTGKNDLLLPMDKSTLETKTSDNKSSEESKNDISSEEAESVTDESSEAAKHVSKELSERAENVTEESSEATKNVCEEALEVAKNVTEQSLEAGKKVTEEALETAESVTEEAAKKVSEEQSETAENVTETSSQAAKIVIQESSETAKNVCVEPSVEAKKVLEVPSDANKNALTESLETTQNFPEELLSGVAKNVSAESLEAAKIVNEESLEAAKTVLEVLSEMAETVPEESPKAAKQVLEESPQPSTCVREEVSMEANDSAEETSKKSTKISDANQNIVSVETPSSVPIPLDGGRSHIIPGSQSVPLPVASGVSSDLTETVKSNGSKGKHDEDKTPANDKDPVKLPNKKKSTDMADLMAQLASLGSNLQKSLPCNRYTSVSRFPRSENPLFDAAPVKRNSIDLSTLLGRSQPDPCRTPVQETTGPLVQEPQASEPTREKAASPTPAKVSAEKEMEKETEILKSLLSTNEEVSNDANSASVQNSVEGASGNVISPQDDNLEDSTSEDSIENLCEICSKSFRGWTNFRVHQYLKHKLDSGSTPGTKYRCRECSYEDDVEMATLVHEESHMPLVPLDRMLLLFCAINDANRSKNVRD